MVINCALGQRASRADAAIKPGCHVAVQDSTWNLYGAAPHMRAVAIPRPETALRADVKSAHHGPREALPKLMLGAIGVVYGDIGTSPLYTMKESFLGPHPLAVDRLHIFGV